MSALLVLMLGAAFAVGTFRPAPEKRTLDERRSDTRPGQGLGTSGQTGRRYLTGLRERFAPELYAEDRVWFALAACNAGLGARTGCATGRAAQGWNAHLWVGHVENAMRLLSRHEFDRQARHGYLTGHRPVAYVRQLRDRYSAYVQLTKQWNEPPPHGVG